MLSQDDFIGMIADLQQHIEKTIKITDELVSDLDDKDLRFKLIAFRQTKYLHLETMTALAAVIKKNMHTSAVRRRTTGSIRGPSRVG